MRNVKINLRLLVPFFWLRAIALYVPYLVPFAMELGLNDARALLLPATTALTAALLEVPTGVYADRRGRKFSLIAGTIAAIVGSVLYATAPGPEWWLFAAAVMYGVSISLLTGADTTLVYETYVHLGRERLAQGKIARLTGAGSFAEGAGALASMALLYWQPWIGYRGVMWIQVAVWVTLLVLVLFMVEPPHEQELVFGSQQPAGRVASQARGRLGLRMLLVRLGQAMRRLWVVAKTLYAENIANKNRLSVLLFGAFGANLSGVLVWWTPVYYMYATGNSIGSGEILYNLIWAGFLGSVFFFALLIKKFQDNRRRSFWLFIGVAACSYTVVATGTGLIAVMAIWGTYFVRALILPMTGQMVNERTTRNDRATVNSVKRMLMWGLVGGTYWFSSQISDVTGSIPLGIAISGIITVGGAVVTLIWVIRLGQLEKPATLS